MQKLVHHNHKYTINNNLLVFLLNQMLEYVTAKYVLLFFHSWRWIIEKKFLYICFLAPIYVFNPERV